MKLPCTYLLQLAFSHLFIVFEIMSHRDMQADMVFKQLFNIPQFGCHHSPLDGHLGYFQFWTL